MESIWNGSAYSVKSNEKFLIAGESYGGYIARGIIYRKFDWVDGLLMICPLIIAEETKRSLPKHVVLLKDKNFTADGAFAERFNSLAVVQNETVWNRFIDEMVQSAKLTDMDFLLRLFSNMSFSFDVDKLQKPFEKPTLVFLGRQDSIVGYKDSLGILENYHRGTFALSDRAGHILQIEQEEVFNSLVMRP